ncbi:MAG: hypothetical protein AB7H43_15765 [Acidimicrobiia bacterium]
MPWCDTCDRFWTPTSMASDGSCPACGHQLATAEEELESTGAPWHFKLLVAAMAIYLAWRAIELVGWFL